MKILFISGWGGVVSALTPLQHHLQQQGHQVQLIDFFSVQELVHIIPLACHADVLIGWSFGGQLATLLNEHLRQQGNAKILITLMSNPCFVAHSDWQNAMPVDIFNTFQQQFTMQPKNILKKFSYLMAKGETQTKNFMQLIQSMQDNYLKSQTQAIEKLAQGLQDLYDLNTVQYLYDLERFQIPNYHIFAKYDTLVPSGVADDLADKLQNIFMLENCGHFAVMSEVEQILSILKPILE